MRARAILIRWHWPPENSPGRRSPAASGSMPTFSLAGTPDSGSEEVGAASVWTNIPTPGLSPAGRCRV